MLGVVPHAGEEETPTHKDLSEGNQLCQKKLKNNFTIQSETE